MERSCDDKFKDWEAQVRILVKYAEGKRLLGCAECAKALLLYGLKIKSDAVKADLHSIDFESFVDELRRRTTLVKKTCMADKKDPS